MIRTKNVTLFGIDTVHPKRLIDAMAWSTRHVRFDDIVLLTDLRRYPDVPAHIQHGETVLPIRLVHHEESDRKVPYPRADHCPANIDYEMASMREPCLHVRTSHMLYMESDSAICNPWAWQQDWLNYDYVGAVWCEFRETGFPACDGDTNNVGNGGFSLRSVKYCEATRKATDLFEDDPAIICSDIWPCINKRTWLESQGIRFAPEHVAVKFSCENMPYFGQFGAHGRWTFELNNWGGRFAKFRP